MTNKARQDFLDELDRTAVISESFKQRLIRLMYHAVTTAYEAGREDKPGELLTGKERARG